MPDTAFLLQLEELIRQRLQDPPPDSYTARIAAQGITKAAQKVGEEGVELALAAAVEDKTRVISEAADLLYHVLLVLALRQATLTDVVAELEQRHRSR